MKRSSLLLAVFLALFLSVFLFSRSEAKDGKFGKGSSPGEKKAFTMDGIDYTFCWCPPGEFMMGSPKTEEGRDNDEIPHQVKITRGFWLLETEVTQQMWKSLMGTTVAGQRDSVKGDPLIGVGDRFPMYYVSWNEAKAFCDKLSRKSGENILLPTEAQWEYACRAGTDTAIYTGNMKILGANNAPDLDLIAWYGGNSSVDYTGGEADEGFDSSDWGARQYRGDVSGTHIVKGKKPNAWGLYDMLGNVWEWCSDWYGDYPNSAVTDPEGPAGGSHRVLRGGSWNVIARLCRPADRHRSAPGNRGGIWIWNGQGSAYLGFRPALIPAED